MSINDLPNTRKDYYRHDKTMLIDTPTVSIVSALSNIDQSLRFWKVLPEANFFALYNYSVVDYMVL